MYDRVLAHYASHWGPPSKLSVPASAQRRRFPVRYAVAIFEPKGDRTNWVYATVGMSAGLSDSTLELHGRFNAANERHAEVFHWIADYHRTGSRLDLHHSVNLGTPWLPDSACTHALVSLPYIDGPALEWLYDPQGAVLARCLWAVPITAEELKLKIDRGVESLEQLFDSAPLEYTDLHRRSLA